MKRAVNNLPSIVRIEDSSRIREIQFVPYENKSMGDIIITFVKGDKRYKYFNVGREIFVQIVTAQSVGRAFDSLLKNQYQYERLI